MANSDQTRSNRRTAKVLLLTGFAPLAVMTLWLVSIDQQHALRDTTIFGLKAYAALALCFYGGTRWGVVHPEDGARSRYGLYLGSMPLAAGWISLVLPDAYGFATLAVAFAGLGAMDQLTSLRSAMPRWLERIRFHLTLLAVVSMIAAFAATADTIVLP